MATRRPVAIVTGSNTGVGYQTALGLARRGYEVIVAARNAEKGLDAAASINTTLDQEARAGTPHSGGSAAFMQLDLASMKNVAAFAATFTRTKGRLDSLILNAGMNIAFMTPAERKTIDEHEVCLASNFLGHFLLCRELLPLLQAAAAEPARLYPTRIVFLGSVMHRTAVNFLFKPDWPRAFVDTAYPHSYNASKLAMVMAAMELHRRLALQGVRGIEVLAVNPGAVSSDIWRPYKSNWGGLWHACVLRPLFRTAFLTTEQGAATSIAAASDRVIDGRVVKGGEYLSPYAIPTSAEPLASWFELIGPFAGSKIVPATRLAYDPAQGAALWECATAAVDRALASGGGGGLAGSGAAP